MVETGYDKHPSFGKAKVEYLSSIEIHELSETDLVYLGEHYREKEKNFEKAWKYFRLGYHISGMERTMRGLLSGGKIELKEVFSKFKDLIDAYLFHRNWKKAVALVGRFEIDGVAISYLKDTLTPYQPLCNAFLVEMIAENPLLPTAEMEDKVLISDFLYEKYIKTQERGWQSFIHPRVLGSALERGGRYTDILEFYSRMIRLEKDASKAIEYDKRWIVNKYNYAKILEKNDRDGAERQREEAKSRLQLLNLRREELPDLPRDIISFMKYRTLDEIIAKTKSHYLSSSTDGSIKSTSRPRLSRQIKTFRLGDISIKYSAENQRINLENDADLTTAMIDLKKWIGKSDDQEVKQNTGAIHFIEWGLSAEKSNDYSEVLFRMKKHSDLPVRL